MCFRVLFLQELFSRLCTLVRSGNPNCTSHLFFVPLSPQLCYSTSLLFTSQRLQSPKARYERKSSLLPRQLYTPFLSIFWNRDYTGLLVLSALLPPLIFCYSNLIQNKQNTHLEAGSCLESP